MTVVRGKRCPHETALLAAPDRVADDPELAAHVPVCASCRDALLVARSLSALARESAPASRRAPSAGLLWWKAEIERRRAERDEALRPLRVAEGVGPAVVFLAACGWWVLQLAHRSPQPGGDVVAPAADGLSLVPAVVGLGAAGLAVVLAALVLRPLLERD